MARKRETRETSTNVMNVMNVMNGIEILPLKEELLDFAPPARFETDVFAYTEIEILNTGKDRSSEKLIGGANEGGVTGC